MKESLKNRNILVIIFELLVIALGIIGITFATTKLLNARTSTVITAKEYNVDYVGAKDIEIKEIEPIDDSLVNYNTRENVIRLEFSVRGVKSNGDEENLIYDVMLNEMDIDCSLLNKYTKWNLYKNGKLLSNGSLDPLFDGNVLGESMRLTTIQEDLPNYKQEYDNYVLIFWLSESCQDLETCELIDQTDMLNSKMSMKVFIALYSGDKKPFERVPNYDGTCANKPELYKNMVPVTYTNGTWVVADENNNDTSKLWYSYKDARWANSIVVKNSSKYKDVGKTIDNEDILGYYVWIPRYRYKLWNATDTVSDTYKAYDEGIDIIFENGLNTITNSENDKYVTHPVFGDNLRGFWISKYELSKGADNYLGVPEVESYRNETLNNYQTITAGLKTDYKLDSNVDSHMVSNLEWGATLYLSHSNYGVCSGDGCSKIDVNNTYVAGGNKQDTTTRNIYGVYDMAGGASEYVLGTSTLGTATKEVVLSNNDTWYNGHGSVSDRDYLLRGGIDRGMFYFGDISMSAVEYGTRSALNKTK